MPDKERSEWEILDDLGKRLTVITEVTETMKESVQKSYLQLHSLTAKQFCNELKSVLIKRSQHKCSLPDSIQQALNSGDGVYRP